MSKQPTVTSVPEVNDSSEAPNESGMENNEMSVLSHQEIIQIKASQSLRELRKFFAEGGFVAEKGDPKCNIQNAAEKKAYVVPPPLMEDFFALLDKCRQEGRMLHYSERQVYEGAEKSGIMIDLDRLQLGRGREIRDEHITKLVQRIARLLHTTIDFPVGETKIRIFCIRKPAPALVPTDGAGAPVYKDGIHILIPEIKVLKSYKKYFIGEMLAKNIIETVFRDIEHKVEPAAKMLDAGSAFVPVQFFGCSKPGKIAYGLSQAYEFIFNPDDDEIQYEVLDVESISAGKYTGHPVNLCYELSLHHYAAKIGGHPTWLTKSEYNYKRTLESVIQLRVEKSVGGIFSEEENRAEENDISLIGMTNPRAKFVMSLLNLLSDKYTSDYNLWFRTLCAIAHCGVTEDYKAVARAFSRRNPEKYSEDTFEQKWADASSGRFTGTPVTLLSIRRWARESSPEKFAELDQNNCDAMVKRAIYICDGSLEHVDVANFIKSMISEKFVTDAPPGCGGDKYQWFEFVTEKDNHKKGEIYKWREESSRPDGIHLFIGERLIKIYRAVKDEIRQNKDSAKEEGLAAWWKLVEKNFKQSLKSLGNDGFQSGVVRQCVYRMRVRGFLDELDSYPDVIGVGNGILKLGEQPVLIRGYHDYKISKYTETDYVPFDPENPFVQRLLAAFRDIFIERDVFEYMMMHAATGLDGKEAACIFTMCVGGGQNGKTFFLKMVHNALGHKYCAAFKPALLTDMVDRSGDANSALMQMEGKHHGYFDEFNKCTLLNTARVKSLVNTNVNTGRDLFSKQKNFKITLNAIALSNFDFIIDTTDHGTWRRMYYYRNKMKFCDNPDPNNPYEKKVDKKLMSACANMPEYKSAMLSIMTHYYSKLCREYGGDLSAVPVPTIRRETAEFRNRQDALNRFITQMVVVSPASGPVGITTIATKYEDWYRHNVKNVAQSGIDIQAQLENSAIAKFLVRNINGQFLQGHRIKQNADEILQEGESPFIDETLRAAIEQTEVADSAPIPTITREVAVDPVRDTYQNRAAATTAMSEVDLLVASLTEKNE